MLTINLIPPQQKERIKLKIYYQNIISSGFILFLLILLLIIFLAGILIFLHFRYLFIEDKISVEQSKIIQTESYKGMEKKITNLNKELSEVKEIQDKRSDTYQILNDISQNLLIGVRIYNLRIDKSSNRVTVIGFAPLRENLLNIKSILEANPKYNKGEIDFPLSNLANSSNINFRFSFTYTP
ncbi:MAG: hypothetical protein A2V69_02785 [Candidatus Portnoybacteria bacterium RBG_13_40_8]|uniref:PilN domain-containing protein n=1 Tax=Candidatus Portnoybacteria bacterium RBG_13_40_8 TaxID=1801990 RepID=A0A1G2F4V1_9BACT|nr:MAG: hypothetical protein A2V69_02785 [Candidatus Portnoybacteria bacterium RBG_13_40_8]OGZ35442.1 MAG: hypothetical protein A2V60_03325 [Candidatus Portnoybacteria bacterium RIFCSPHIGHO2_01_FULL_39_19]